MLLNAIKVIHCISASRHANACAITIGNFDGVHRGHQALLAQLTTLARDRDLIAAAMIFEPHPRDFFAPQTAPRRISNLRDKICALAAHGVARVYVVHFDARIAACAPERFVDDLLVRTCHARAFVVGDDFRFGAQRTGDISLLRAHAPRLGYSVHCVDTVTEDGTRISSSAVRAALAQGDLSLTARLLNRPYSIRGHVLHGAKLGRTIGYPTLNLRLPKRGPALSGIYAVVVHGLATGPCLGVASIGLRPTVESQGRWLLETYLLENTVDAYGRQIEVEFVQKIRDEEKFSDLDQLKAAIADDCARARTIHQARGALN